MLTDSKDIKTTHREAMKLVDKALVAKAKGDIDKATVLYIEAFELEKLVALSYNNLPYKKEPNRSILFRSAAVMAKEGGLYQEAERMIAYGLQEVIHDDIAQELRDLYEKINFHRHLELKGIELSEEQIQLSLHGDAVSLGLIQMDVFLEKLNTFNTIAQRKLERTYTPQKDYRSFGKANNSVIEKLSPYLSIPRAASYAITIQLGTKQLSLFDEGRVDIKKLIDDIIYEIELVNNFRFEKIEQIMEKEQVKDKEPYLRNLISLVQKLSPDGQKIKQVGFSVIRNNETKTLPLRTESKVIRQKAKAILEPVKQKDEVEKTISGKLEEVYGRKDAISITDGFGNQLTVNVPKGLDDLVKEHFNEQITIRIHKKGKHATLVEVLD